MADRVPTSLRVLGPLEVVRDGSAVRLGSRQQRRLLAVLLVHANEVVSRDRLVDVLWGEEPPPSATHTLQTVVSRLRSTMADGRLETCPPGYRLRVGGVDLDVLRFEERVRVGLGSSTPAEVALDALDEALALWRGSPYAEFADEEFAGAEVARLVELRARAVEERFAALLELDRSGDIIGELETEIAAEPFRERLRALLMLTLARSGRPVEGLRAYEAFRRFLAEEVGVVPSPELQALNDDILRQDPDVGWAALATKDAGTGEPSGNLPLQASSFVGRHTELARVSDALERSRVVTLTGVGGVGKTRLALQVAREVLARYRNGAWFSELAAVRDAGGVVDAVAGVFRVGVRPGLSLEESLVAYLRDQELLLVLDNCEHVLQGAARLTVAIAASCPRVRVLATSREGLNIPGEQLLVVPPMKLPDEDRGIDGTEECEAVRLFADRARAINADFRVDAANRADVLAVCKRLDGMALAIELAAARVGVMSPGELALGLDRRFRLLRGGGRVASERHQTLRAAIDWSYGLLTESEQRLLARLSIFSGGCTLSAAEAVCACDPIDADDMLDLLAGLVARSLVVANTGPETRYRLLETIREYGEERLAEVGETDAMRVRHADYFTDFAGLVQGHLYGLGQVEWGARLAGEHDNLRAVMTYALDMRDADVAFGLFCRLPTYGLQVNDLMLFDPAPLLALPGVDEHPGSSVALFAAAYDAWLGQGDTQLALELCDEALATEERLGPVPGAHVGAWSSELRGEIAQSMDMPDQAVQHFLDAASRARDDDVPGFAAYCLGLAAQVLAYAQPALAQHHANVGLALARDVGMPLAISYNLVALALAHTASDPDAARALLAEALELETTLGYESPQELLGAVFAAARLDDWPTALRVAERALHHHIRSGALGIVYVAATLNVVARGLAQREPESAAVLQGAAGAVIQRLPSPLVLAWRAASTRARISADVAGPVGGASTHSAFVGEIRSDATRLITTAVGEQRLRELRAEGAAMDETEACAYARSHIREHLRSEGAELH